MDNSTSYTVVPQPSMDVCNHNGTILVNPPNSNFSNWRTIGDVNHYPYNNFKCVDLSKELPVDFIWNYNQ